MAIKQTLQKREYPNTVDFAIINDPSIVKQIMEENNIEQNVPNTEAPVVKEPVTMTVEAPKDGGGNKITNILVWVLLAAVIVLFVLFFSSKGNSKVNPDATPAIVSAEGGLKIAYINTDTLMAKYQYALDLNQEIKAFQESKMKSAEQQMAKFQKDYEAYLKEGANMTLTQQKAKEKELQDRAAKMQTLEQEVAMQIQEKTLSESEKMTNAIYAFIREYNLANQKFDLILAKSFSSSPILYGNEGLDITNEIIEGLNKEYEAVKSKK